MCVRVFLYISSAACRLYIPCLTRRMCAPMIGLPKALSFRCMGPPLGKFTTSDREREREGNEKELVKGGERGERGRGQGKGREWLKQVECRIKEEGGNGAGIQTLQDTRRGKELK